MTDFIANEIYTDSIGDVVAKCANFIIAHPDSTYTEEIDRVRLTLAVAHRQSRIYTDREHRDAWDREVRQAINLLKRAGESAACTKN